VSDALEEVLVSVHLTQYSEVSQTCFLRDFPLQAFDFGFAIVQTAFEQSPAVASG